MIEHEHPWHCRCPITKRISHHIQRIYNAHPTSTNVSVVYHNQISKKTNWTLVMITKDQQKPNWMYIQFGLLDCSLSNPWWQLLHQRQQQHPRPTGWSLRRSCMGGSSPRRLMGPCVSPQWSHPLLVSNGPETKDQSHQLWMLCGRIVGTKTHVLINSGRILYLTVIVAPSFINRQNAQTETVNAHRSLYLLLHGQKMNLNESETLTD